MSRKKIGAFCLLAVLSVFAQDKKTFTLEEVIALAKSQSPASKAAKTNFNSRYWQYRLFKANYLPQLSINGTLPNYNQSISVVTQPNGSNLFVKQSYLNTMLTGSLVQNVRMTGGTVYVSSGFSRLDLLYNPDPNNPSRSFLVNPILIGLSQPVFGFNRLKWDNRIEPLKYEEAKRKLNEDMEGVSMEATDLFFNLLLAQMTVTMQEENVSNSDTLYKIANGRFNLGKIAENELLQIELNYMQAQSGLAQAKMDRDFAMLRLANYLKIPSNTKVNLLEPKLVPVFKVDENLALEQANKNSQRTIGFKRSVLEANMEVQNAKRTSRFQANLNASYGITNSGTAFEPLYNNGQPQQQVQFTFSVPVLNWGRSKAAVQTAIASRELVQTTVEQDQQNFVQEILLLAKQTEMYRVQLLIAMKADTIAQKRYDIARARYLIGKVTITDLNLANQDKISTNSSYISALRNFWMNYFNLRRKTLYDFEKNEVINYSK